MLKFFRKYMKYVLVVMVSLLMVAFLIQPVMGLFRPNPMKQVLGQVGEVKITRADLITANTEMDLLRSVGLERRLPFAPGEANALGWTLIQLDSARMGLGVSNTETDQTVEQILQAINAIRDLSAQPVTLAGLARRYRISEADARLAIQKLIISMQYQQLVMGVGRGFRPRLSEPMIERYLHDQSATVKLKAVKIASSAYVEQVAPPSEQRLTELFEQYKDTLPTVAASQGGDNPYALGYRQPDRIKIEYIAIPADRLRERAEVDEAEMISYYEANKAGFVEFPDPVLPDASAAPGAVPPPPAGVRQKTYKEVRGEIEGQLRTRKAGELGLQMLHAARTMLDDEARGKAQTPDGYLDLGDDWSPMALHDVAQKLEQQFNVAVDMRRLDDRWLDRQALAELEGIGSSVLRVSAESQIRLVNYAFSADELVPLDADNPLAILRLQVGLPSQPVLGLLNETLYLFRLIEAQPARSPSSLDEVRQQVSDDAYRIAAYELLWADQQTWAERLQTTTLEELAEQAGSQVLDLAPFPRRDLVALGMDVSVPLIPEIGRSQAFVDAVFDLADQTVAEHGLAGVGDAGTSGVAPLPQRTSIVLFKLEDYTPMTRSLYLIQSGNPTYRTLIDLSLRDQMSNPLTLEALVLRTGYVAEGAVAPRSAPDGSDDQSE